MEAHVERMIEEHAGLIIKIAKLDNFLYGNNGINIHTDIKNNKTQEDIIRNMVEFGNKAIQLRSMRTYLTALECRLENEGIVFENGEYLERVGKLAVVNSHVEENKDDE